MAGAIPTVNPHERSQMGGARAAMALLRIAPCLSILAQLAGCLMGSGGGEELSGAAHQRGDGSTFCDRPGRSDRVRDLFCAEEPDAITGLTDLHRALDLAVEREDGTLPPDVGVTLFGHSTALSGEVVSELNPRAIVYRRDIALAFSQGLQQVEITVRDRETPGLLNFYLIQFEQACNGLPDGCSLVDLYTPSIESNWTLVRVADDEDLKNTPADCRRCHQRGLEQPVLLMRELAGPWTHVFGAEGGNPPGLPEPSGSGLLEDFLRARGDQPYAGLASQALRKTSGAGLQNFIGPVPQPLLFPSTAIESERFEYDFETQAYTETRSATWDALYAGFRRGENLAPPFYAQQVTDAQKREAIIDAYQRLRSDRLAPDAFPDPADIFPDDPQLRAEIGLQTEPEASPVDLLIQACADCHNDVLDQSISRARFNVALGRMGERERQAAVTRLRMPPEAAGAMPPAGERSLPDSARNALIAYLMLEERPAEDDARLQYVAEKGMAMPAGTAVQLPAARSVDDAEEQAY